MALISSNQPFAISNYSYFWFSFHEPICIMKYNLFSKLFTIEKNKSVVYCCFKIHKNVSEVRWARNWFFTFTIPSIHVNLNVRSYKFVSKLQSKYVESFGMLTVYRLRRQHDSQQQKCLLKILINMFNIWLVK